MIPRELAGPAQHPSQLGQAVVPELRALDDEQHNDHPRTWRRPEWLPLPLLPTFVFEEAQRLAKSQRGLVVVG